MITAADYADIQQTCYRYSYAMDARRWELMNDVFLPDALIIMNGREFRGRAAGVGEIREFIECCSVTHHMNTNLLILESSPDRAHSVLYFQAWHRGSGEHSGATVEHQGTYTDDFQRTSAGWRIAKRDEKAPIEIGDFRKVFAGALRTRLEM